MSWPIPDWQSLVLDGTSPSGIGQAQPFRSKPLPMVGDRPPPVPVQPPSIANANLLAAMAAQRMDPSIPNYTGMTPPDTRIQPFDMPRAATPLYERLSAYKAARAAALNGRPVGYSESIERPQGERG